MRAFALLSIVVLSAGAPVAPGAGLGSPAPALSGKMLDGQSLESRALAGKITVLNFWATWCPPCRAETPDLIAAYAALHAGGVNFLGIDTTESAPIVKTFLSAKGVPYPTALAGPDLYNAYAIAYIPTTVVIDANGIERARWIGAVTPQQLTQYVRDARAGRSSNAVSPVQAQIDALLVPQEYHFDGGAAERSGAVKAMNAAIARAESLAQRSERAVDYERTQHAEGMLRTAAGSAVRREATTNAQRVAGLELLAQGAGDLDRWADAARAYRDALAISPNTPKLVAALSRAYYRLHDYDAMIAQAIRYTQLAPADGDGWSRLGLAYQRARRFSAASRAYEKTLGLLTTEAANKPTQDALADVADTSLDAANVYVSLGNAVAAQRAFALANAYGDRLKGNAEYATLKQNVKERTQEGLVAVAVGTGSDKPVVSVAPWTGPDLPGSLASTLKYRLIVAAPVAKNVTLKAEGLRPEWVASFCADGLCSPQTVSFKTPPSGLKTYEFQLVPPHDGARPGRVAIAVNDAPAVSIPVAR